MVSGVRALDQPGMDGRQERQAMQDHRQISPVQAEVLQAEALTLAAKLRKAGFQFFICVHDEGAARRNRFAQRMPGK